MSVVGSRVNKHLCFCMFKKRMLNVTKGPKMLQNMCCLEILSFRERAIFLTGFPKTVIFRVLIVNFERLKKHNSPHDGQSQTCDFLTTLDKAQQNQDQSSSLGWKPTP